MAWQQLVCHTKIWETLGYGREVRDVKSEVGVTFIKDICKKIQGFVQWVVRTNLNVYLKKLGLEFN